MPGNHSLDEFLSGDDGEPPGVDGDGDSTQPGNQGADGGAPGEGGDPAADPIATTYGWSPEGGTCPACGAVVEERWNDGGELVCAGCKDW